MISCVDDVDHNDSVVPAQRGLRGWSDEEPFPAAPPGPSNIIILLPQPDTNHRHNIIMEVLLKPLCHRVTHLPRSLTLHYYGSTGQSMIDVANTLISRTQRIGSIIIIILLCAGPCYINNIMLLSPGFSGHSSI